MAVASAYRSNPTKSTRRSSALRGVRRQAGASVESAHSFTFNSGRIASPARRHRRPSRGAGISVGLRAAALRNDPEPDQPYNRWHRGCASCGNCRKSCCVSFGPRAAVRARLDCGGADVAGCVSWCSPWCVGGRGPGPHILRRALRRPRSPRSLSSPATSRRSTCRRGSYGYRGIIVMIPCEQVEMTGVDT